MFTGLIQAVANIKKHEHKNGSMLLTIATPAKWQLKLGDSIATNGVCLTVTKTGKNFYQTELMAETLARTTFKKIIPVTVNLERPLRLIDFLDGHIVQGHVDAVGKVVKFKVQSSKFKGETYPKGAPKVLTIRFPKKYSQLIVEKGSIAVDGISLTIVAAGPDWFSVALIPHTLKNTTLNLKKAGDEVNLEFDIIAKYICKKH